jgi:hypothetical protein
MYDGARTIAMRRLRPVAIAARFLAWQADMLAERPGTATNVVQIMELHMCGDNEHLEPYDPEEDHPDVYARILGGRPGPGMFACYHLANPANTRQETCPTYPRFQGDKCIECGYRLTLGSPSKS